MRYLVTGGAGFIGSHLVDALLGRGNEVLVLDDLSTGRRENLAAAARRDGFELVHGSVVDRDLVDECMESVDMCFHLASAVGVHLIVSRPLETLLANVRGTDAVLAAAARHRRRLLFASTSEIYGKGHDEKLAETSDRILGSPFRARWSYSTAKAFGEALLHAYAIEEGCDMVAVRLFNTTGPRQSGAYGMVLPRFVRQALAGDDLTVYGDGTQSRCFLHVADAIEGILEVADEPQASGGVYNIGSSEETRIVDLARLVIEAAGAASAISFVPYDEAYGEEFEELGRRRPDTSALRELTGWRPRRPLRATIGDILAHERSSTAAPVTLDAATLVSDLRPAT